MYHISNLLPPCSSVYLASPFFNEQEIEVYHKVINYLREDGFDVYVPQEHEITNSGAMPNWQWGAAVFNEDARALRDSDAVIVINWGMYSDSGTAWEAGYAFALGKPVVHILVDSHSSCFSLMMMNGCYGTVKLSSLGLCDRPADSTIEQK